MCRLVDWGINPIDLNGFVMKEAVVLEQKEYVSDVQDGIEKSKQVSGRARRREVWTRDIWSEGSVDQNRWPMV